MHLLVVMRPSLRPANALERLPPSGFVRLTIRLGEWWDALPLGEGGVSTKRFMEFELCKPTRGEAQAMLRPLLQDALGKVQQYAGGFFGALERGMRQPPVPPRDG